MTATLKAYFNVAEINEAQINYLIIPRSEFLMKSRI
ncbi:hypothetical protein PEDI_21490 [Persicobacter diffluens]|uniref:Uncharacterized protein n=1 Tax=Persicobacter diffluens TaxID=981 RepID=A0AAN4VY32_9BACT|nr:hypothetical protein PEDI_21490 [Persicobacter diffluens]